MQSRLPSHSIILLGVGHTNAHVLKMWRMNPVPEASLTCVSLFPTVTYSGMLPGVLSEQYQPHEMSIDLVRLCSAVGARLIVDEVTGLDRNSRQLLFRNRPPLSYDLLSIGIGSVPNETGLQRTTETSVPFLLIKPMQTFLERLHQTLKKLAETLQNRDRQEKPVQVTIVGGGAAGVEIAFCLPAQLKKFLGEHGFQFTLINAGEKLAPGFRSKTQELIERHLHERNVKVIHDRRVIQRTEQTLVLSDESEVCSDLVLWATGATSPPLLEKFDLDHDERGFLLIRPTLQTLQDDRIFAVGDTASFEKNPVAKSGVYAVREGPVLWENLQRSLTGRTLIEYKPQRGFNKLINLGDGTAICDYKWFTFEGAWVWRWKDRIDTRFMKMYQNYQPTRMLMMSSAEVRPSSDQKKVRRSSSNVLSEKDSSVTQSSSDDPLSQIRCLGCGGKIGSSLLNRVLSQLDIPQHDRVMIGLDTPMMQPFYILQQNIL